MWQNGQYTELLTRIEAQAVLGRAPRRQSQAKRTEADRAAKKRRGRKQCAEGAYRKAVQGCSGDHTRFTPQEEAAIAAELVPRSQHPDRALAVQPAPGAVPEPQAPPALGHAFPLDGPDSLADDHPLKGVRYASLTMPGPSGTRAGHAKECLGVKQRPVANRLARAMLRVQKMAAAGSLAPQGALAHQNKDDLDQKYLTTDQKILKKEADNNYKNGSDRD